MVFILAAFGLLLHVLFWGAGLALLITPRTWRAGWPALIAPAGLALQSAVVWFGAQSGLPGTQSYGWQVLPLPVLLLVAGVWKARVWGGRNLLEEARPWAAVAAVSAGVLSALVLPMAWASPELTTASLGSCDAADYAAGARTLMEFSRHDRGGFMGLTEVVQLHSVDNFFAHWIRLNHFTPSSLLALNGTILGRAPHEIVSVLSACFVALSLPTVFWFARATFRYGPGAGLWIAAVYGLSPLLWYAVYHAAMSQMLAAIALALLTGAAIALWRELPRPGSAWRWAGVLAVSYWLIMGAYNFIVIVSLVPAVAYVGGLTLYGGEWRRFWRWTAWVLAPLAVVALVFTQRTLGLVERFVLFQQFDFGWPIPPLTPEGWLGILGHTSLEAIPGAARWIIAAAAMGLIAAGALSLLRTSRTRGYLLLAASVPILCGYGFLIVRGIIRNTRASYDAYKLFCVFYPGLLAAFAGWLVLVRARQRLVRQGVLVLAAAILAANGYSALRFARQMTSPPLLVDEALIALKRVEADPHLSSLNLRIPEFWSRLWANAFLLRKPQYFESYTYEGRRNTELKGAWDLHLGLMTVTTPASPAPPVSGEGRPLYTLVPAHGANAFHAAWGTGWYDEERLPRAGLRWRWSGPGAELVVRNSGDQPARLTLRLTARSLVDREL